MSEHTEQCALVQWAAYASAEFPALRWLHSSLNGARLTPGQAGRQSAAGMVAGVADLYLPATGCDGAPGLFIELKIKGGKQSPKQKAFEAFVTSQGYRYVLAWNWPEAAAAVLDHLGATDEQRARLIGGRV